MNILYLTLRCSAIQIPLESLPNLRSSNTHRNYTRNLSRRHQKMVTSDHKWSEGSNAYDQHVNRMFYLFTRNCCWHSSGLGSHSDGLVMDSGDLWKTLIEILTCYLLISLLRLSLSNLTSDHFSVDP